MNATNATLAIIGVLFFASCNSAKVMVSDDSSNYSPAEKVEILITAPEESFTVITRLDISGPLTIHAGVPELLEKLREKAEEVGADAIIPTIEGLESFEKDKTFNPWVTSTSTVGDRINIISANAIIYDSLKASRRILYKIEKPRIAAGIQANGLAVAYNGYGGTAYIGEDQFRTSVTYVKMDIPVEVIKDNFNEAVINYAIRSDIDYFFQGLLRGPYLGVGLQYGSYTYGHPLTTGRGTHIKVEYSLSAGYKLNIWRGLHLDARASANGKIYGSKGVGVGNLLYTPSYVEPFASVALGFEF